MDIIDTNNKIIEASICTKSQAGFKSIEFNHSFKKAKGPWKRFQKVISQHWSPVVFKNSHRKGINFISCDLLTLDIDNGYKLVDAYDDFADYACMIGLTKSHQKAKGNAAPCDRFRIVCPLESTITNPDHYKQIIKHWVHKCHGDKARTDLAPYFAPCTEVIWINEGKCIEVPEFIPINIKPTPRPTTPEPRITEAINLLLCGGAMGSPGTGRHKVLLNAIISLWQQGHTDEQILSICEPLTNYTAKDIRKIIEWTNNNLNKEFN